MNLWRMLSRHRRALETRSQELAMNWAGLQGHIVGTLGHPSYQDRRPAAIYRDSWCPFVPATWYHPHITLSTWSGTSAYPGLPNPSLQKGRCNCCLQEPSRVTRVGHEFLVNASCHTIYHLHINDFYLPGWGWGDSDLWWSVVHTHRDTWANPAEKMHSPAWPSLGDAGR